MRLDLILLMVALMLLAWKEPLFRVKTVYRDIRPGDLVCVICERWIPEKYRGFAEEWGAHPGILGPIHPECYEKAVEETPDLPWTDPISGQVDYREMGEALGISDPETDFEEECY